MYAKWNKNSGGGGGSTTTYFYFAIEKVDAQDGHALNAATVRNYRGSTPELLNGEDHFAYIAGHNDGNVYPKWTDLPCGNLHRFLPAFER